MTAAAPDSTTMRLARAPVLCPTLRNVSPAAEGGDRIFLTLLSLNFMLLAFFVVLGTTSSFDPPRAASVAQSMHVVFASGDGAPVDVSPIRLTARQAMQAGVAEAFAEILPLAHRVTGDNGDRADVSVPAGAFTAADQSVRDATLDGIANLLRAAPAGLRYQLLLNGGAPTTELADGLLARGVTPRQLMIGNAAGDDTLHFSFLLLEGEDDSVLARVLTQEAP